MKFGQKHFQFLMLACKKFQRASRYFIRSRSIDWQQEIFLVLNMGEKLRLMSLEFLDGALQLAEQKRLLVSEKNLVQFSVQVEQRQERKLYMHSKFSASGRLLLRAHSSLLFVIHPIANANDRNFFSTLAEEVP